MQKHLPKHLSKKSIALQSLLVKERKNDWKNKPASWPDIRKNAQDGHIYLLVDDRYPVGFVVTATGGYTVKIDGTHYADYASDTQFSMDEWVDYSDTPGYDISEPTGADTAHIVDIYPTTEGNNITAFKIEDRQGLLWLHSNVSTEFDSLRNFVGTTSGSSLIMAVTAKNNILKSKDMAQAFGKCSELEYVPVLDFCNSNSPQPYLFYNPASYKFKKVIISNLKQTGDISNSESFTNNYGLEQIIVKNSSFCWYNNTFLMNLYSLKKLPEGLYNSTGSVNLLYASSLEPTNLDFRDRTAAGYIKVNGDATHTAYGIKSLRVSNQAPFDGTNPQIDVSYTGMDRSALVQLFNDLPTVTGGQIINITGCTGAADLTAEEALIPDSKGWTLTR